MPLPPRSSRLPELLRTFDVDCGDDVFPGHRLVVRGVADHGRSRDDLTSRDSGGHVECQTVALVSELVPGVTAAEEAAREPGTPFTVDATYEADVPPTSSGGPVIVAAPARGGCVGPRRARAPVGTPTLPSVTGRPAPAGRVRRPR